jgi:hypothetical protein
MPRHKPITHEDIQAGRAETRRWDGGGGYNPRENGRSTMDVQCPFCEDWITVHLWSFAGCGKRCDCGAYLSWHGNAYKLKEKKEKKSCKRKTKSRVSKKRFKKVR